MSHSYIGRFAPSPSGPLHMGSLMCALASFLDAKANNGNWLLRIEDIDPPREQPGATESILQSLLAHRLNWDGDITYQSQRSNAYLETLEHLNRLELSYACTCTRKRVAALKAGYDGRCRGRVPDNQAAATRLNVEKACKSVTYPSQTIFIQDAIQGSCQKRLVNINDFIIHRKDNLFAYQLAVVVDDIAQGVTHIVRGYDLFDHTPQQIFLTELLGGKNIHYAHIPVLMDTKGSKLSKQHGAAAINDTNAAQNLLAALLYLQQSPPDRLRHAQPMEILAWAIENWSLTKISRSQVQINYF